MYSYILKNGSYVVVGNGLLSVFALVTTLALTHLLPKETFGSYRYIFAMLSLLSVCTLPDMGQALTRAISKKELVNLKSVVLHKMQYGLIGSLASLALSAFYLFHNNTEMGALFAIMALFIPFSDVFLIYTNILYGEKKFGTAIAYDATTRFFSMCVLLGAVYFTKNIFVILLAYFLSNIISQFIMFLRVRRKKFIRETTAEDPSILNYGKQLTLIGGVSVLAANLDKLIVWHLLGADALALYAVALLIASEGARMTETISIIILPFLAEASDKKNIRTLLKALPLLFCALVVIGGIAALLTPAIFPMIFPTYTNVIPVTQLSFILLVLIPINSMLYRYLVVEMWKGKMLTLQTLKIAAFSIIAVIMIPRFGLLGACIALIAAEALASVFLLSIITSNIRKVEAFKSHGP